MSNIAILSFPFVVFVNGCCVLVFFAGGLPDPFAALVSFSLFTENM